MNITTEQGSGNTRRVQDRLLSRAALVIASIVLSSFSVAQTATIELSTQRDFVYQDGVYEEIGESILPFVVTIDNPGTSTINDLSFTLTLSSGVSVGNVDSECVLSEETVVLISCTIDELKAKRSKVIDFFVDGPNSLEVGAGFTVTVASTDATVSEPDAFAASLADGDRSVSGSSLFIHLVRNIDLDIDQNGVPDVDEAIMNLPESTPAQELLAREAVVDVLFVYSPSAAQYLGPKLDFKANQVVSIANQIFRDNGIALQFQNVGLEEIPYTATDTSILSTFDALVAGTDPAFDSLGSLILASGGDIVVMMHAIDTSVDTQCGFTTLNAVGRQGDFRPELHQGELLSAINVGPDCLSNLSMATVFASNMGIATERQRSPNGGTFSYSSAYGVDNTFFTLGAAIGTQSFGAAAFLNRFSNPDDLCLGLSCGVNRNDVANGADAVYSLNKTRHLVSAITPSVFPLDVEAIEEKTSLINGVHDLEVTQTSRETSALVGEFTEIEVSITNTSALTLSDIDVQFSHVNDGSIVEEPHLYETSSELCTILGSSVVDEGVMIGDALQKTGTLSCSITSIKAGESLSFSYRIQIDLTPPVLNTQAYYHELVTLNGAAQLESLMCIPVFLTFVDANAGSNVCSEVQNLSLTFGPQSLAGLDQEASVTGNRLSVPFIRLDDGSLVSAEFMITFFGEVRFELLSYQTLDGELTPLVEASLTDAGLLNLPSLLVGGVNYEIDATLEAGSDPVAFGSLLITTLSVDI